jgi:hypothetical protein
MHQGSYMCSCFGVGINVGKEMDISIFAGEPNLRAVLPLLYP